MRTGEEGAKGEGQRGSGAEQQEEEVGNWNSTRNSHSAVYCFVLSLHLKPIGLATH